MSAPVDTVRAALTVAARGWRVIPCHSIREGRCSCSRTIREVCSATPPAPGKHPRTRHGLTDATTDPEQIRAWWTSWPDAHMAIVTGAESGLVVLDVDPRHGGDVSLAALEAKHGRLDTVEALTGGGGRHLYFAHPGGRVPNSAGRLGPGLDVRGDGGYVLAPPSGHISGGTYQWEASSEPGMLPLAPMPEWMLGPPATTAQPAPAVEDVIPEGQRDSTLASLAGSMRRRGMVEEEIAAALTAVNARRCRPPLPEAAVSRIARSVGRYEPAPAPEEPPPPDAPPGWLQPVDGKGRPAGLPVPPRVRSATGLRFVRAADVELEDVEWSWPGYLPLGKVVVLDGDPGVGKSSVAIGLAAQITRGRALPSGSEQIYQPADVVLSMPEDGMGDTIKRRLMAADADQERVHLVDLRDAAATLVTFPRDVETLEAFVRKVGAQLLVIAPLMAHLAPTIDSHKDQDIRLALTPLSGLAQRTGCTVLIIRHLNKAHGGPAIYRGGGSIGVTGAARLVLLCAKDPDRPGECVLAHVKGNLGPPPPSLSYRIQSAHGAALVCWGGESRHTSDSLLAHHHPSEAPALCEAEELLRAALANGPQPQADVEGHAKQADITPKTLRRAKKTLGVQSEKRGFPGRWYWSLPTEDGHAGAFDKNAEGGQP